MNRASGILFFILFHISCVYAQSVVRLSDTTQWNAIGKHTSFFLESGDLDVQQVLQPAMQMQFKPYQQEIPNFGSTKDAVWLRFTARSESAKDFYLQIGSAFIDSISLYAVSNGQPHELQQSGDNYVFSKRPVKVTTFIFPLPLAQGSEQTYLLRLKTMQPFFFTLRVGTLLAFMEDTHKLDLIQGIYLGCMLLILCYNLFLFFSTREKLYLYYVAYVASITWFMSTIFQYVFEFLWPYNPGINQIAVASSAATMVTATIFTRAFLQTKIKAPYLHKLLWIFIAIGALSFVLVFTPFKLQALMLAQGGIMLMAIFFLVTGFVVYRKNYPPAKFYLTAWGFLIAGFIAAILETVNLLPVMYYINAMQIGSAIEVTLLSLALADRINVYKQEREEAQAKALLVAREKAELVQQQNILLEKNVAQRTHELTESLQNLQAAQSQLIHNEKMASLGELTAGIAHEIQNPLNFVNNFSEINEELVSELVDELNQGNTKQAKALAEDIKGNAQKTNFHGKRAETIVKAMLQHSRSSTGNKEPVNINDLCEEYLRLAYHGLKAKDISFLANYTTAFDVQIPDINVVPQDIGRVLLNLISNAFYAVNEKAKQNIPGYEPKVHLNTSLLPSSNGGKAGVLIVVEDNGDGIADANKEKIFQPFFTTKPPGQGTGLGLSLSYDIVKAHGGDLKVETKPGEGSTFIISLPG